MIEADFNRRVGPSLKYARAVGNLCSGSIYLALASLIDHEPSVAGAKLGLYSYGSGCASEFFSGVVTPGAREELSAMEIGGRIRRRREISFTEYEKLLPWARECLIPMADRTIDLSAWDQYSEPSRAHGDVLVLTGVEKFHRGYEWR